MRKMILLLPLLLLAACGDDAGSDGALASPTVSSAPPIQSCEDRTPPAPAKVETLDQSKPDVEIPDGAPPCKLVIQDIHEGTGAEAAEGATVTVQYVGVSWSTGEQFDASWDRGEPSTFPLSDVIPGWQEGIPGMKVGGRRQLIIPSDLAYGSQGRPGIAPNETLVFIIDLLEVQ